VGVLPKFGIINRRKRIMLEEWLVAKYANYEKTTAPFLKGDSIKIGENQSKRGLIVTMAER
jgi:hypothetical protein